MDMKTLKIICIVLAAAFVMIPSAIAGMTDIVFSETVSHFFLSLGILCVMAYVLVDIKNATKKQITSKLAACVGLLYVLIMQWIG